MLNNKLLILLLITLAVVHGATKKRGPPLKDLKEADKRRHREVVQSLEKDREMGRIAKEALESLSTPCKVFDSIFDGDSSQYHGMLAQILMSYPVDPAQYGMLLAAKHLQATHDLSHPIPRPVVRMILAYLPKFKTLPKTQYGNMVTIYNIVDELTPLQGGKTFIEVLTDKLHSDGLISEYERSNIEQPEEPHGEEALRIHRFVFEDIMNAIMLAAAGSAQLGYVKEGYAKQKAEDFYREHSLAKNLGLEGAQALIQFIVEKATVRLNGVVTHIISKISGLKETTDLSKVIVKPGERKYIFEAIKRLYDYQQYVGLVYIVVKSILVDFESDKISFFEMPQPAASLLDKMEKRNSHELVHLASDFAVALVLDEVEQMCECVSKTKIPGV